jgi:hypothetical protein
MALAQADVLSRVRYLLNDVITGAYRWSDAELILYMTDASKEVGRRRPEALASYSAGGTALTAPSAVTAINDLYMDAVVNYTCWRACSKDAEDGNANLAGTFFQAYQQAMGFAATR